MGDEGRNKSRQRFGFGPDPASRDRPRPRSGISPARRLPFVIVGAGIGGLTAALSLAAKGFEVVLVERAAELSEIGAGIQITPNAGRVLASLGLEPGLAARATEPAAIDVIDGRAGARLTSIPADTFRARFGLPYRVIHRADLQAILVAAVNRSGIRLELGANLERHLPQADGVLVRLRKTDGLEVLQAEAVIAADGVWSALREAIPGSSRPSPTGRTAWRAMIPADLARRLVPTDRVALWLGRRAHLVHYPVDGGAAVNVVAILEETWAGQGWSTAGAAATITENFARWSPTARNLVAAVPEWQKFPVVTVDPAGQWLGDRLALLGDAAHALPPFLAQGAAMAIEDAAVLAEALTADRDTPSALRSYVRQRQPRVLSIAAASRRAGRRFHMQGPFAFARNIVLRAAGDRLILAQNAAIYGWRASADDPVS